MKPTCKSSFNKNMNNYPKGFNQPNNPLHVYFHVRYSGQAICPVKNNYLQMKLSNIILTVSLVIMLVLKTSAQPVVISGKEPTYAGDKLTFYRITDYISMTEKPVCHCVVDSAGNFSFEIQVDETIEIFAYLGIYKVYLWVEPHKQYQIILPQKTEKSPEEILNPYFQPVEVHLAIENFAEDELNTLIMMFKDAYNPYYEKHVMNVYAKPQEGRINTDIEAIEKHFTNCNNEYFNTYRYYKYGELKFLAYQQKTRSISQEYFTGKPVLYSHPAYMNLFNQVYNRYFIFLARTENGKKIYDDINQWGSYSELLKTLSADKNVTGDTLSELVILKSLYDEYYGSDFSRSALIKILDSLILKTKITIHKEIGLQIKNKITRLQAGYEPPFFELYDADSNLVKLSALRGKYIYLNFCTSYSYTCINEYELLNRLYQKHKKYLTIVTISTDPHESSFNDFKRKNDYNWIFLYYGHQPEIIKEYDIRAYPTYFLIGPDGKLIYSPAASPSENFETKLFEAMRARGDL